MTLRNANDLKHLNLAGVEKAFANNGYAVQFRMVMWDRSAGDKEIYRITYRDWDSDILYEADVFVWMGDDGIPRAEF